MPDAPPCPTCDKSGFESVAGMKRHHALQHGESIAGEEVACSNCDGSLHRRPHEIEQYDRFYCGDECRAEHQSEAFSGEANPNYRGAKSTYECHWCGASVEKYPSHVVGRVFCSDDCRAAWQSESFTGEDNPRWARITVPCDYCGTPIDRRPSRIARHEALFCTEGCKNAFHSQYISGEDNPNYRHGKSDSFRYGANWSEMREEVLQRDGHECQECGMELDEHLDMYGFSLHVHHDTPLVMFEDADEANSLDNLTTLCVTCHGIEEQTA